MVVQQRHDELLQLLRRKADWTVDQLARDLGVSRRTILRDLNQLRDRGFHISAMTGPGGGVHLQPTSVMVTSQLDGGEVVALILTVAIAKATPGVPFAGGADRALAKIEAALPSQRSSELQTLMQRVMVGDPSNAPIEKIGNIDPSLVAAFEMAFTADRLLSFRYTNARGDRSHRRVEPHGMLIRAPLWYVIAWDPKPNEPRLFRADRIRHPSATADSFIPRPHELVTGICPDATSVLTQQASTRAPIGG